MDSKKTYDEQGFSTRRRFISTFLTLGIFTQRLYCRNITLVGSLPTYQYMHASLLYCLQQHHAQAHRQQASHRPTLPRDLPPLASQRQLPWVQCLAVHLSVICVRVCDLGVRAGLSVSESVRASSGGIHNRGRKPIRPALFSLSRAKQSAAKKHGPAAAGWWGAATPWPAAPLLGSEAAPSVLWGFRFRCSLYAGLLSNHRWFSNAVCCQGMAPVLSQLSEPRVHVYLVSKHNR